MKNNYFLVGFFLLITTVSGVVASELAANELVDSGNWSAWDKNNSTGENISGNDSWKLVFSGQKIDDSGGRFISPDSTRMAYLNHSDKGYSLVVAGPGRKIEGKTYEDIKDDVIFSPDSTRVAYKARTGDKWIAIVDSSEGKQYDEILSIAFSPDSKRVTYLAKAGNKIAVVVDGEEKLYDNTYGLIFSPDSKHLAYYISRGGSGPYVVLDGKEMEKLGNNFVFSPDSARWAYSSVNAYLGDPVYVVLNNKTMDLGTDGSIYGLYFSPDGKRFAFDMRNGPSAYGSHKVVVDEVYGKEYQFPGVGKVFFSPDSRHVAHKAKSNGEGYFVVLDGVEGKNYSEVREPFLFSPDSNHTAYAVGSNDGLHVVLDGKEGSNYTDVWSLTFSPDNKHLAYAARASREGKDVQFIVVDGKEGQPYVRDWSGQGILYGPVFSPDGKLVSRQFNYDT
jgi:WD40-like Beta Propeller Repeat